MEKKKTSRKASIWKSLSYLYKRAWDLDRGAVIALPFYILCSALSGVPLVFIPALAITKLQDEHDYIGFAWILAVLLGAYALLTIIAQILNTKITWNNTFTRMRKLYADLNGKTLTCDYRYYDDERLKQERQVAESALWSNWRGAELLMKAFPSFCIATLGLIVYISYSGTLSLWMILILLSLTISNVIFSVIGNRYYERHTEKPDNLFAKNWNNKYILRDVNKAKDVRNYDLGGIFNALFVKQYTLYAKYAKISNRFLLLPNLSNSIFGFVRDIVGYLILSRLVIDGSISLAAFSSMIGILNGCSNYISSLSQSVDRLLKGHKQMLPFHDFLEMQSSFNEGEGVPLPEKGVAPSIEFDDVSFAYQEGGKETISHLSFSIASGEKIALVGENGAGKTTIVKLLSLFYKPTGGQIRIAGEDILAYNANEYRTILSSINQENVLPSLRIDQVVSAEIEPDEGKVIDVLKSAGLWEKIDSLPKKQESYLTQDLDKEGVMLSGGQNQLLMLARALYKDGSILLLDEPTSALDPIVEGRLYEKYSSLCQGKTSIFISHRLSSTRFCDRIFYLEDGKIKECGTHEELMAKKGSYYELFEMQAHYYRDHPSGEGEL